MCGGSSNDGPGSTGGKSEGGYGGMGMGNPGSYGGKNDPGRTSEGGYGKSGFSGSGKGDAGAPSGLRSAEAAKQGLSMAGPQLSRARDNSVASGLSYGIQALGMMGLPMAGAIAMGVRAARDYGRSFAERTSMEKAAAALGMGAPQRGGGSAAPTSGGLAGISKPTAKPAAQAPAKAGASGNVGSGSAGATVIMGADKARTGAGAGSRAKSGSAVRGFGSGGLKL